MRGLQSLLPNHLVLANGDREAQHEPRAQRSALAAAQGSAPHATGGQEHGKSIARTWQEHGKSMGLCVLACLLAC